MEKPNLNYVEELARGDESIRKTLISVIQDEFPQEKEDYYKSLENKDYKKIEDNVHRIKHKISILGLEKSYRVANLYEKDLINDNLQFEKDFDVILEIITNYLNNIN